MEFDPPCAYTRGWTTIFVPCLFGPPSGDTKNRQVAKLSDPMRVLIFAYEGEDSEESSKLTHIYIYRFDRVYISNQEDSHIDNNSIKSRTDLEGTKEDSLYPSNYGKDGIDPR